MNEFNQPEITLNIVKHINRLIDIGCDVDYIAHELIGFLTFKLALNHGTMKTAEFTSKVIGYAMQIAVLDGATDTIEAE